MNEIKKIIRFFKFSHCIARSANRIIKCKFRINKKPKHPRIEKKKKYKCYKRQQYHLILTGKQRKKQENNREKQRENVRREATDKRRRTFRKGSKKKYKRYQTWSSDEEIYKQGK